MLKLENTEVMGWEHAIRGMRNPKNSWERSDSALCGRRICEEGCPYQDTPECQEAAPETMILGPNDHTLMITLRNAGTDHRKFMRMITVYVDITAPLYWWKEFDTYKVGTVANSCSTMHKIAVKEFNFSDFSTDHLLTTDHELEDYLEDRIEKDQEHYGALCPSYILGKTISTLNYYREKFLSTKDKLYWWQMIQLLPSSYNQRRTVMLNYEVLANIYKSRRNHKLDEWHILCYWIEKLPYSELITGRQTENDAVSI